MQSVNKATDFFARMELNVAKIIRLKIRKGFQTKLKKVTASSLDVAADEQCFFAQPFNDTQTMEQTLEGKECGRLGNKRRTALIAHNYHGTHKERQTE